MNYEVVEALLQLRNLLLDPTNETDATNWINNHKKIISDDILKSFSKWKEDPSRIDTYINNNIASNITSINNLLSSSTTLSQDAKNVLNKTTTLSDISEGLKIIAEILKIIIIVAGAAI